MQDAEVYEILLSIEKIVQSPSFGAWQNEFINAHIHKFEYGEENKLEYTDVFQEYEDGLEQQIVKGLDGGAAKLSAFMEALPPYLDGPMAKKEETARAVTMLMQMSEFEEFKEMMMYMKKEREDKAAAADGNLLGNVTASDGAVLSIEGCWTCVQRWLRQEARTRGGLPHSKTRG